MKEIEKAICSNLEYFSGVTQRTLSAFHVAGTDGDLSDEIEDIKRFITKLKYKKLIKIEICGNEFKKIYSDGSSQIVKESEIFESCEYESSKYDFNIIEEALSHEASHITNIKISNKIDIVINKTIERPSEIIFFM